MVGEGERDERERGRGERERERERESCGGVKEKVDELEKGKKSEI